LLKKNKLYLYRGYLEVIQGLLPIADPVAQPVEHLTFNQRVVGSNPAGITKIKIAAIGRFFYYMFLVDNILTQGSKNFRKKFLMRSTRRARGKQAPNQIPLNLSHNIIF
jgi:hypothetical protein